jgi:hypothetical protein
VSVTRRYGSVAKAKSAVKGGGAGSDTIRRLKADETLKVRFLQNPEDWHGVYSHYVGDKPEWCSRGEDEKKKCRHCEDGIRRSKYALANVLLVKESKTVVFQMPASLADKVLKHYSRNDNTVLDRDYDLVREGAGKNDTRYDAFPDAPKRKDLTRYELHDIEEVIGADLGEDGESDEPEDEEPKSTRKPSRPVKKSRHEDEDDEDEEDEEEDEDGEEDQYAELDRAELKAEIKKYDSGFVAKKSQSDEDLRDILRKLAEDEGEDEDEEEEERPRNRKSRDSGLDEFRSSKSSKTGKSRPVVRRAR